MEITSKRMLSYRDSIYRIRAIQKFLEENALADLSSLYKGGMEVQVNVQSGKKRIKGSKTLPDGTEVRWTGWTDGEDTWKPFRIPWSANKNPHYKDSLLRFSTDKFEAIGLSGWDWRDKVSRWVGYDFDSILGHTQGLSEQALTNIQRAVQNVPWVTIRKSTSGNGLHLYVHFKNPPTTETHTEHAALARAVLGVLSARAEVQLDAAVDCFGTILWIWHRRANKDGFSLVKKGEPLDLIPQNWRDHLTVIRRQSPRAALRGDSGIDELALKTRSHALTERHQQLLGWLENEGVLWWWDSDRSMLVCHTSDLKRAHTELNFQGPFETVSTGKDQGNDQNCFLFPLDVGWVVRRHSKNVKEHPTWVVDNTGWVRAFYDRPCDFATACQIHEGVRRQSGAYTFKDLKTAAKAIKDLGLEVSTHSNFMNRPTSLTVCEGHILVSLPRDGKTDPDWIGSGWARNKREWEQIVELHQGVDDDTSNTPDNLVRHLTLGEVAQGWSLYSRGCWIQQGRAEVTSVLRGMGFKGDRLDKIIMACVMNYWKIVHKPFQPEYPGHREWNRNAAQLSLKPEEGEHPTWDKVLDHVGAGLDESLCGTEFSSGAEYLLAWAACLVRKPYTPLPYLFLYGPQNSGKSMFHEALYMLFKGGVGYVRADHALRSASSFNAELSNAVLCVVEETNLSHSKGAYDRVKDWVTSKQISIHPKGKTPYEIQNTTHWIQCANDINYVKAFPGDTRITYLKVNPPLSEIPKPVLLGKLDKELAHFIYTLLHYKLPDQDGRMGIRVIDSYDKINHLDSQRDLVDLFIEEYTFPVKGHSISLNELHLRFLNTLDPINRHHWNYRAFHRHLPMQLFKGRAGKKNQMELGNRSFDEEAEPKEELVTLRGRLIPVSRAIEEAKLLGLEYQQDTESP